MLTPPQTFLLKDRVQVISGEHRGKRGVVTYAIQSDRGYWVTFKPDGSARFTVTVRAEQLKKIDALPGLEEIR